MSFLSKLVSFTRVYCIELDRFPLWQPVNILFRVHWARALKDVRFMGYKKDTMCCASFIISRYRITQILSSFKRYSWPHSTSSPFLSNLLWARPPLIQILWTYSFIDIWGMHPLYYTFTTYTVAAIAIIFINRSNNLRIWWWNECSPNPGWNGFGFPLQLQ